MYRWTGGSDVAPSQITTARGVDPMCFSGSGPIHFFRSWVRIGIGPTHFLSHLCKYCSCISSLLAINDPFFPSGIFRINYFINHWVIWVSDNWQCCLMSWWAMVCWFHFFSMVIRTCTELLLLTRLVSVNIFVTAEFKIFISPADCGVWTHPHFYTDLRPWLWMLV